MKEKIKFYQLENGDVHITQDELEYPRLKPNEKDAPKEKHVPVYERVGDKILVRVGELPHPMEEEHYIKWVTQVTEDDVIVKGLKPGDMKELTFDYIENSDIYAYCNLHGLWKTTVEEEKTL